MTTSSKSKSALSSSNKVTKAVSAKAAKLAKPVVSHAPAKEYQGPLLQKPTAALDIRKDITPAIIAPLAAEAKAAIPDGVETGMPFATFIHEAVECAMMVRKYWTTPNPDKYRSLSLFAYRLGDNIAAEIMHLVDLAKVARDDAKVVSSTIDALQLERAKFVNRELRSAADFDADDGVQNQKDEELGALKSTHATEPRSIAELADSLGAYARHCKKHQASLMQAPDFKPELIAEAELLSDALLVRRHVSNTESSGSLESRDVYIQLLRIRVAKARKVARHAFRSYPEVVREATSAFHRERRRTDRKPDPLEGDEPLPAPADGEQEGDDA